MDTRILHSLIPLEDFKAVLGLDDRDDTLSRYCLITATYSIEQYCKRRLLRKKHTDYLTFMGEHIFALREYPIRRILAVWAATAGAVQQGEPLFNPENMVDPKHYFCLPDEGIQEDIPFSLVLRSPLRLSRGEMGIRVRYLAGYVPGKAPYGAKHPRFPPAGGNEADALCDKGDTGNTLDPGGGEHLQYHPDLLVKAEIIGGHRKDANDQ
jgi:hypothetical protein